MLQLPPRPLQGFQALGLAAVAEAAAEAVRLALRKATVGSVEFVLGGRKGKTKHGRRGSGSGKPGEHEG